MNLSELSDQLEKIIRTYGDKFKIDTNSDWYLMKLQEEAGELASSYLQMTGRSRKKDKSPQEIQKNFEDEISDVLAMTILLARSKGIDLDKAFKNKWFTYL
jgi:NTP pyrophosphatase (non-canonical NTP hydrolase)